MATLPRSVPVVIAGAGPTGVALAVTLHSKGVDVIVVDPDQRSGQESSRAVAVHAGTLERLETLHIGEELVAHGAKIALSEVRQGDRTIVINRWSRLDSPFPFVLAVAQETTETVLRNRLASLGGTIHVGASVQGFVAHEDSVAVAVLDPDGREQTIEASYLVGCDGAHSTVRSALGLDLEGATYAERFLLADAELEGPIEPDQTIVFISASGPLLIVPMGDGHVRLGAIVAEDENIEIGPELLERFLVERTGTKDYRLGAVASCSEYQAHRRRVGSMRQGRVFLCGDAAHVHSPVGGQGMNLGIHDAFDLGIRLGAVLREQSGPELLDGFEGSRLAHADRVTASADRLQQLVKAQGLKRIVMNSVVWLASRFPPAHDRVVSELAGLSAPWPDKRHLPNPY